MRRRSAAAALALALLGAAAAELARGSVQQDFVAYFTAGRARRLGLDPYLNHLGSAAAPTLWDGSLFRHSRFLYPPLAADAFRPLAALPFGAAKALFSAGAVAALVAAAAIGTAGRPGGRAADPRWMLGASAVFFPVYLHFDRGQIDLYLLPLLVGAWRLRGRALAAGALLAVAAAFKPASLALLPALLALGRGRMAAAAVVGVVALAGVSALAAGPGLLAEYVRDVLPRAALYGEGGTEAMLLESADREPLRLGLVEDGDDRVFVDGRGYDPSLLERVMPWPVRVSASLPRLLAPDAPSRPMAVLPGAIALLGLLWAAREFVRRRDAGGGLESNDGEALIYLAAMVASVVTSPVGWAMGLVWALPLLEPAARLRAAGRLPPRMTRALGLAGLAAALPSPIAGLPAIAGAALAGIAAAAALSSVSRAAT